MHPDFRRPLLKPACRRLQPIAWAAAAALLVGCVTPPAVVPGADAKGKPDPAVKAVAATPPSPAGSAPGTVPGAIPPRPPEAGAPKAFAEVIKDARRDDGFLPVWRKDEKVWLEVAPDQIGKPMLVSVNVASSVGERGLYGSQMGPRWMAEFRKVGSQMLLVARQTGFRGNRDPATARAVAEAFSDSLIGSTPVASAPHPERKSVLIDASFLLGDLAGYSTRLEAAYRLPFTPDRANSYFDSTRAEPGLTALGANVHFAIPRIPAAPVFIPGAPPPPPRPTPPTTTGDPRSLFVGFVYNFRELPVQPMRAREADPRVGFFTDSYSDLSDDLRPNTRVHHLKRWRLEKADPAAALSEPRQPITYWLDKNIPARYRDTIRAGILEWNKAFERIGFKNAIVVRQQLDESPFNNMDAGHASVRWFVGADVGFAIGPSHSDPRSGEILDADIGMSDVFGRGARRLVSDDLPRPGAPLQETHSGLASIWDHGHDHSLCTYAMEAAGELHFAQDLLEARGDLDPASPEADAFVQAYIKDVTMHEVGHTLGLRHNFRSSTTVTRAQLQDEAFGTANGITNSVMDYTPFNVPVNGERKGQLNMTTLGAYDYWAIEYGYKPVDAKLPAADERQQMQAIAARSAADPRLAFADDADASIGLDPMVNVFDLGDDPLAWAAKRLALSRELWARTQDRGPKLGDEPLRLRRSVLEGFRQLGRMPDIVAKYVGGMHVERQPAGTTQQPVYRPVDPRQQRQALAFLSDALFKPESFDFRPEFLASLSPDFIEWDRGGPLGVPQAVLRLQTEALDRLMSPGAAQRLLDLPNYLPANQRAGAISLSEVYSTLSETVWSELKTGRSIDPMRRSLQRDHLRRVQSVLLRPSPMLPADAVSLTRLHAVELQSRLQQAVARKSASVETRAHLQESLGLLTEALRAAMQRG